MVWVRAETAGELAGMMQAADAQLPHERPQLDAATKPTETDSDGLNGKVGSACSSRRRISSGLIPYGK